MSEIIAVTLPPFLNFPFRVALTVATGILPQEAKTLSFQINCAGLSGRFFFLLCIHYYPSFEYEVGKTQLSYQFVTGTGVK